MTRYQPRHPRPYQWLSGPDETRHQQYIAWLRHRSQARFRGEIHDLTFEQWCDIWHDHWHRRGRGVEDYNLTRLDQDLPWSSDNCCLMTRHDKMQAVGRSRRGQKYNKVKK